MALFSSAAISDASFFDLCPAGHLPCTHCSPSCAQ
jgi:hypothetical protein